MSSNSSVADDIIKFWFPEGERYQKMWFHSTPETDKIVRNKFSGLLTTLELNYEWRETFATTTQGMFALILMFDQISRHIYRGHNEKRNDNLAFIYAQRLVAVDADYELKDYLRPFALMPFRHKHTEDHVYFAMKRVESYREFSFSKALQRFHRVTKQKLEELRS